MGCSIYILISEDISTLFPVPNTEALHSYKNQLTAILSGFSAGR